VAQIIMIALRRRNRRRSLVTAQPPYFFPGVDGASTSTISALLEEC